MKLKVNPSPFHLSVGERGEMIAWDYLKKQGYEIVEKNYRCSLGEMDVVAKEKGQLVFVEIKTRRTDRFGLPEEAVHLAKQKKLIRLTHWYLKETHQEEKAVRFDVLAIRYPEKGEPEFRLIRNAFEQGEF